jgi:hypothetical protein
MSMNSMMIFHALAIIISLSIVHSSLLLLVKTMSWQNPLLLSRLSTRSSNDWHSLHRIVQHNLELIHYVHCSTRTIRRDRLHVNFPAYKYRRLSMIHLWRNNCSYAYDCKRQNMSITSNETIKTNVNRDRRTRTRRHMSKAMAIDDNDDDDNDDEGGGGGGNLHADVDIDGQHLRRGEQQQDAIGNPNKIFDRAYYLSNRRKAKMSKSNTRMKSLVNRMKM